MALANIATIERNGKRVTLIGKDIHALTFIFSDEKSRPFPSCVVGQAL